MAHAFVIVIVEVNECRQNVKRVLNAGSGADDNGISHLKKDLSFKFLNY
jgi:hypothetical protein